MEVSTFISHQKPEITVLLSNSFENTLKSFHCSVCGKVVFEYYNPLRMLLPGEPESALHSPIVVQCNGATTNYIGGMPINGRCKARYFIS